MIATNLNRQSQIPVLSHQIPAQWKPVHLQKMANGQIERNAMTKCLYLCEIVPIGRLGLELAVDPPSKGGAWSPTSTDFVYQLLLKT